MIPSWAAIVLGIGLIFDIRDGHQHIFLAPFGKIFSHTPGYLGEHPMLAGIFISAGNRNSTKDKVIGSWLWGSGRVLNGGGDGLIDVLRANIPRKTRSSNYVITTWNQNQDVYRKEICLGTKAWASIILSK